MVGVTGKKFIQPSLIKTSFQTALSYIRISHRIYFWKAFEKLLAVQDNITLHDRYGWCTL